ncbi:hypothetical protein CRUP_021578 [Coryphaenoides rupestris]|nr:hypothetical protein CRUP_021578 [Coryphaenoides rupestris]
MNPSPNVSSSSRSVLKDGYDNIALRCFYRFLLTMSVRVANDRPSGLVSAGRTFNGRTLWRPTTITTTTTTTTSTRISTNKLDVPEGDLEELVLASVIQVLNLNSQLVMGTSSM